jgi:hypothetical protein
MKGWVEVVKRLEGEEKSLTHLASSHGENQEFKDTAKHLS